MRKFQGIVSIWTQTYREIFKSALAYLYSSKLHLQNMQLLIKTDDSDIK